MKIPQNQIYQNLISLRKSHGYTQEYVAEYCSISRQTVAKWENGESEPNITYCIKLSNLYNITVDDLIHCPAAEKKETASVPSKGKYFFGIVTINERGQIVIPKKAREIFHIQAGDGLCMWGDESQGIALSPVGEVQGRL